MEEVERLCDMVGIVDHGSVVALGTPHELIETLGDAQTLRIVARGDLGAAASRIFAIPGVSEAMIVDGAVRVTAENASALVGVIASSVADVGVEIEGIEIGGANLESVFLKLTGRTLRD